MVTPTGGGAAWRDEVTELWPAAAPFAAQIDDPGQMTMARYSHGTLRHPTADALVHIGNTAHRASPQLGQGVNMALLDALALALAHYRRARRWHMRAYHAFSAVFTPHYQSDSRALP